MGGLEKRQQQARQAEGQAWKVTDLPLTCVAGDGGMVTALYTVQQGGAAVKIKNKKFGFDIVDAANNGMRTAVDGKLKSKGKSATGTVSTIGFGVVFQGEPRQCESGVLNWSAARG